jgi:hypothetical protein
MIIRVEIRNDFLGNEVFWEGDAADTHTIRNVVARRLAAAVAFDGDTYVYGMWHASRLDNATKAEGQG